MVNDLYVNFIKNLILIKKVGIFDTILTIYCKNIVNIVSKVFFLIFQHVFFLQKIIND
jgi:hypothetical protein